MPVARNDAGLLRHLSEQGIPFVVIGGWAVISHGYERFTKDVDLVVPDTEAIRARVTRALADVGGRLLDGRKLAADQPMPDQGWQAYTDLGRVDILLEGIPPLDFAGIRDTAVMGELDGVRFPFADLAHLVAFKRLAGRVTDQLDLEHLERLHGPLPILPLPGIDV